MAKWSTLERNCLVVICVVVPIGTMIIVVIIRRRAWPWRREVGGDAIAGPDVHDQMRRMNGARTLDSSGDGGAGGCEGGDGRDTSSDHLGRPHRTRLGGMRCCPVDAR